MYSLFDVHFARCYRTLECQLYTASVSLSLLLCKQAEVFSTIAWDVPLARCVKLRLDTYGQTPGIEFGAF